MMMAIVREIRRRLLPIPIIIGGRKMVSCLVCREMRRRGFGDVHAAKQHPEDDQQSHKSIPHRGFPYQREKGLSCGEMSALGGKGTSAYPLMESLPFGH
jgi:hypothetical protein